MKGMAVETIAFEEFNDQICERGNQLLDDLFTEGERQLAWDSSRSLASFASIMAAKEALIKAYLSIGGEGIEWDDLEMVFNGNGKLMFQIASPTRDIMRSHGTSEVKLSVSELSDKTVACVVVA